MNTGCRFFFMRSNFAEQDHLHLLVLHLLLHGKKCLDIIEWRLRLDDLHFKWQSSAGIRILSVRDVDWADGSLAQLLHNFSLFFRVGGADCNLIDTFP